MNQILSTIINILAVMEISLVNLFSLDSCAKKKMSGGKTFLILLFSSVIIIGGGFFVISKMKIYGNGNGIFIIFGFLYLIPLSFIYNERPGDILIIICTAWVYTLGVFSLGVQLAKLFDSAWFAVIVLVFQTVVFSASYIFFRRFLKRIYKYILGNITRKAKNYLRLTSISWFFTLLLVHLSTVMTEWVILDIINVFLLVWSAGISYFLLYELVRGSKDIAELSRSVNYDNLTGLGNRILFDKEISKLLETKRRFFLMFLDLDKFKNINDNFGHNAGDEYLKQFSRTTRRVMQGNGGELFRIAGDEFLGLYDGDDICGLIEKIKKYNEKNGNLKTEFLGVSIGYVAIDSENKDCVDDIISCADRLMYAEKNSKYT